MQAITSPAALSPSLRRSYRGRHDRLREPISPNISLAGVFYGIPLLAGAVCPESSNCRPAIV